MNIANRKQNESGFTIIEVVLVLAIAGLIFLIVFLALPQLQKSRRDTQRKNDVGRFMAALETYSGNNNGNYPANASQTSTMVSGYLSASGSVFKDPTTGSDYTVSFGNGAGAPGASLTIGTVIYRRNASCGTTEGTFAGGGGTRKVAAMTAVETGVAFCQDNQ